MQLFDSFIKPSINTNIDMSKNEENINNVTLNVENLHVHLHVDQETAVALAEKAQKYQPEAKADSPEK